MFQDFFQADPPIEEITPPMITRYLKTRKDVNNMASLDENELTEVQKALHENYSLHKGHALYKDDDGTALHESKCKIICV